MQQKNCFVNSVCLPHCCEDFRVADQAEVKVAALVIPDLPFEIQSRGAPEVINHPKVIVCTDRIGPGVS